MSSSAPGPLTLTIGREELTIRKRYEVVSIADDALIAVWFVVGSLLFFSDATTSEITTRPIPLPVSTLGARHPGLHRDRSDGARRWACSPGRRNRDRGSGRERR